MKLRIRADSLRLRLTQSEVRQLRAEGRVSEVIHFGPGRALEYALVASEAAEHPQARYEGALVEVSLPLALAHTWAEGDAVSIRHEQALPEGALSLLIEKDFQCLAPREGEDDGDAFPNPQAADGATC
ncbi:hypothetical protein G6O69_24130 [Pseudenhygromyxa sp. WMMC2535]|uniref:DUF7009 family protein n=1 Tax=Pseudenhygromyxa sp. WMMC2535 TaxID=2712867 RepID=UPI001551CE85|nr:hypothetical protein [Pseudenhygromyxa sp. WMMC2535]NVB40950.1 hypothetical protein [Pseudenhygromyxa sp. WMMC2535]